MVKIELRFNDSGKLFLTWTEGRKQRGWDCILTCRGYDARTRWGGSLTLHLLSAVTEAAPGCGRGCDTRSIQKRLDKRCEHVCPVTGIPRVRRDEERFERRTNAG